MSEQEVKEFAFWWLNRYRELEELPLVKLEEFSPFYDGIIERHRDEFDKIMISAINW